MKIAIMTQPLGKNYGGIMQAWALQQVLKRMGHEVVTIDRQPDEPNIAYKAARYAYRAGKKSIGKRTAPINFEKHLPYILQYTNNFIDQNIIRSEPLYSTQQLRDHFDRENYDAVIVGSDQTWRPQYSPNIYNYFLDFLEGKDILRIAYASSFGVDDWEYTAEQTERCAELAKKFDAVSVRESAGVELCSRYFGVQAEHVLDPTLLLDKNAYKGLISEKAQEEPPLGIYSYILDWDQRKKSVLNETSKKTGMSVFTSQAEADFFRWTTNDLSKYIMPSPKKWIEGFNNCSAIVTDSFHGTAFAIIFQKPFYALVNDARGASRFHSLLNRFKVAERLLFPDILEINELNSEAWQVVDAILEEERLVSLGFLEKSLRS